MEGVVKPSPEFWHGRRVLVTGHTGFKGCWLSLWLKRLGADVTGLALAPAGKSNLFTLTGGADGIANLTVDLRDAEMVTALVTQAAPEAIFHLAAQALVRPSYADPVGTYAVNVMGTAHVLDAARHVGGVRAIVNVTSDKCYENREWLWAYREDEAMGGFDPYSSSKGCSELITSAWRRSFFPAGSETALASARAGNVIGGGDWAVDRIVPDCVRAFARKEKVTLRNPGAVRPWQHVLEPLCGYILLAERLGSNGHEFAEAWNFGPSDDDVRTVLEVVSTLARVWGDGAAWEISGAPRPHEANLLKIDAAKARHRLGWRPRLSFERTLEWTAEWYRRQTSGEDALALTLAQIDAYQAGEVSK